MKKEEYLPIEKEKRELKHDLFFESPILISIKDVSNNLAMRRELSKQICIDRESVKRSEKNTIDLIDKQKRTYATIDPNGNFVEIPIPMEDLKLDTLNKLVKLTTVSNLEIARAQFTSGYQIANSILIASRDIAASIEQLADEIERKNKQDELCWLLDRIDEYEDMLMKFGCLEEVYENLALIQYPVLDVDDRTICLLLKMGDDLRERVMNLAKQNYISPLRALSFLYAHSEWYCCLHDAFYGRSKYNGICCKIGEKFQKLPVRFFFEDKIVHRWEEIECDLIIGGEKLSIVVEIGNRIFQKIEVAREVFYELFELKMPDLSEEISLKIVEILYSNISDKEIKRTYGETSFTQLKDEINRINRDIQLTNLRSLYTNLRNAVRERKISRYLEKK